MTSLAVAVAAALAVPALPIAGSTAMAATAARRAPFQIKIGRVSAGGTAAAGAVAAGTASRSVRAWGHNASGQLGNGTTADSDTPVKVKLPKGVKVRQVRAGCAHTLALTTKGHVLGWGDNAFGQLGNGTTTGSDTPVRVKIPKGTKITAIRAGCDFSLALTSRHHVLAWGDNGFGQLGNGTTTDSDRPVRVKLSRHNKVTAISAGHDFSLARTAKGHARAWGSGAFGQLGNGATSNSDVPVKVRLPKGATVKALAAGDAHGLARTSAGLYSWGYNSSGQLGDGTTTERNTPVKVVILISGRPRGHVTSLFAGCDHSLALFSRGALLAWGDNEDGELGNGTTTSSSRPVRVLLPAGAKVRSISAGCVDSFALTAKGHVLAWGAGDHGKLGDGSTSGSSIPVRVHLPSGRRASAVGAGPDANHALAILRRR
jgi:alpha-tubulin suppressor-like RCC1 family protein